MTRETRASNGLGSRFPGAVGVGKPRWLTWETALCLTVFLTAVAIWALGFGTVTFTSPDAHDYAQMGRELVRGDGFATLQIFPRHLPLLQQLGLLDGPYWPNLYRYPLPTVTDALFQLMVRDPEVAGVLQTGFWYMLGIPLVYWLAHKLAGSTVALLSALFYASDPFTFSSSYQGLTEPAAITLFLAAGCLAVLETCSSWKWFALGAICGLAFLDRTQLFFLVPFSLIYAGVTLRARERFMAVGLVLVGALVVTGPWAARNWLLMGDPLFSFQITRALGWAALPGLQDPEIQLCAPISTAQFVAAYGAPLLDNFLHNVFPEIISLQFWGGMFDTYFPFPFFFVLSFFLPQERSRKRPYNLLRWGTLLLILCNFLLVSMSHFEPRFFDIFRPAIAIFALDTIMRMAGQQRLAFGSLGPIVLAVLVCFALGQWLLDIRQRRSAQLPDVLNQGTYARLASVTQPSNVVAAHISWPITMYSDRRTIRLPAHPRDLVQINEKYLPIDYVVLAGCSPEPGKSILKDLPIPIYTEYCQSPGREEFLAAFRPVEELPGGALLYERR